MLHVGLTGNIASGKSCAARIFAELGAWVIDADAIAHEALAKTSGTFKKVVEAFGDAILSPEGDIDRKKLGEIVFNDSEKRSLLNSIVHPEVRAEIRRRTEELEKRFPAGIIILEAALLVESARHELCDCLIVVTCDPNLQLARLIGRDGLTVEQAKARMAAQMPVAEKLRVANYSIDTSGTLKSTREQIETIYRDLLCREIQLRRARG